MSRIEVFETRSPVLGINGLERIGKLTLWHHVERKYFKKTVADVGRHIDGGLSISERHVEEAFCGPALSPRYGHDATRSLQDADTKGGFLMRLPSSSAGLMLRNFGVDVVDEGTNKSHRPALAGASTEAKMVAQRSYFNDTESKISLERIMLADAWVDTRASAFSNVTGYGGYKVNVLGNGNHNLPHNSGKKGRVVVSYSHHDVRWRNRVKVQLSPLARQGLIDYWDDGRLQTGDNMHFEIKRAFESAAVAILLVSADFLASDFITKYELPLVLASASRGGTAILPVIVSACRFLQTEELSPFKSVNPPERPLNLLPVAKQEVFLTQLAEDVIQILQNNRGVVVPTLFKIDELTSTSLHRSEGTSERTGAKEPARGMRKRALAAKKASNKQRRRTPVRTGRST